LYIRKLKKMKKRDIYTELAKRYDLRSRAYFKIKDIDNRYKIFKSGDYVIDIGAAPGGWIKYIAKVIGFDGKVIGVDIKEIEPFNEPNVEVIIEDIFSEEIIKKLRSKLGEKKVDVIVSDASPNITGVYEIDTQVIFDINKRILYICDKMLKHGGSLVVKTFEGKHEHTLIRLLKKRFKIVRKYKPKISRKRSSETYYICFGFR